MKKPLSIRLILSAAALCATPTLVHADADFTHWQGTVGVDARLYQQMDLFADDGNHLQPNFEHTFADNIKYDVFWRGNKHLDEFRNGTCNPMTDVEFLDGDSIKYPPNWQLSSTEKEFEDGFVRVEAIACLRNSDAKKAMTIFLDNDFRIHSLAQLSFSKYQSGLLCEGTSSVPFVASATSQCMNLQRYSGAGAESVYGTIAYNTPGAQPVYFRENLVTFVDLPSGGVGAHLVMWARADRISGIFHGPARGKLSSAQRDAFAELDRRMGQ